jgi:hypothetical protein
LNSATYPATPEKVERTDARRFTGEPPTAFGPLDILGAIARDPNVSPAFRSRLSAVKLEEIEADARAEDLWLARGGSPE